MSANPFDEFRRAAPAANPFDEFQPAGPTARQTLTTAVTMKPDSVAEAERLAKRYPAPPEVIMQDLEAYRLQEVLDLADTDLQKAPMLREIMRRDVKVAAMAQDDTARLADLEQRVRVFGELKPWNGPEPTTLSIVTGLAKSIPQAAGAIKAGLQMQMGDALEALGLVKRDPVYLADQRRKLAQAVGAGDFTRPNFESSTASGIYGGAESFLRAIPGVAASVAMRSPTPAMIAIGGQTQAEAYGKYRARGGTPGESFAGATGEALVEIATEYLPGKYLAESLGKTGAKEFILNFIKKDALGEQAATILQDAIDTAIANPDKTWEQYLAERPDAAYQTLVATLTQAGLMSGVNTALRRVAEMGDKSAEAQATADALQQAMAGAEASRLRERSPDQFRSVMSEMSQDGTLYVDAGVLNQMPPEVLAQLPGVVEALQSATADTPVEVKLADALTVLPGTPQAEVFMQNARTAPDAPSLVEAEAAGQKAQEFLQQEAQRVIEQAADQEALRQSQEAVKANIQQQLAATGRFRDAVNEGYATWAAAFYTAYGSRLGMTPEQFYQRYPLRVLGAPVGQQTGVLNAGERSVVNNMTAAQIQAEITDLMPRVQQAYEAGNAPLAERLDARLETLMDALDANLAELEEDTLTPADLLNPVLAAKIQEGEQGDAEADVVRDLANRWRDMQARQGDSQAEQVAEIKAVLDDYAFRHGGLREGLSDTEVLDAARDAYDAVYGRLERQRERMRAQAGGVLNQAARVTTGRPIFQDIVTALGLTDAEVNSTVIEYMTGLPGDMAFLPPAVGGLADVVEFLHRRRMESGLPALDIANPEDRAKLARLVAAEALAAIRNAGDSLEWYDTTVGKTLALMALKYPELNTDANARTAFLIATAIASQGLNVEDNLAFASEQYEAFRAEVAAGRTGKFPILGKGESAGAMEANFQKANDLLEEMGPDLLRRFLATPFTVRELETAGFTIGGENMDTMVLGSAVFGPKIGFGFYSNLNGNFEPVTMDMWFMRTIGRLAGTLPAFDQAKYDKQVKRFRDALKERGAKARGLYASQFDKALVTAAKTDDGKMIELARLVKKAHEKDFKTNRAKFDDKTRVKTDLVAAAETILFSLEKPRDVPASGGERNQLRDVVSQVVDIVAQNYGGRVPPAALQALIWYPEQEFYKAMGVKLRVTSQDYAGAARKLLEGEGFNGQQLDAAAESGSRLVRPADGQADAAAVQGNDQGVGRARPLEADERTRFLVERNARIVAEQRAAAARIAFEVAPDPNDVALTARWRQLTQPQRLAISDRVARAIVPKVLKFLKTKGEVLAQVGSYLEDTNPSFALRVDKGDVDQLSKILGFVLSQDSMMAIAPAEFPGSFKAQALRIELGEKTPAEVDQIYQALRAIKLPDGRQPIAGQSTSGGVMTVLLESQDDAATIGALVDQALAGAYNVTGHDVFAAFPEKQDYDYALPESDPAGDEGLARQRARDARQEASDLLRKELDSEQAAAPAAGPLEQQAVLEQGPRGTFNPQTLELVLNPNADLSTWFHETGHFFLEVLADVASQPDAPAQIVEDYNKVLAWFGVTPQQWAGFSLDEKRPYHERWAESIEQYVMEGKAPSVELQGVMRRFRAWLTSVYGSIKKFLAQRGVAQPGGETLGQETPRRSTQEVARIFSRMVKEAEQDLTSALFNWNDSRLNEDKDKIVLYPGRDARFVRGKEGGKSNVSKAEFLNWLMSDAPFDPAVYGESIKDDAEWRGQIEKLRGIVSPQSLAQGDQPAGSDIQLNDDIRRVMDRMLATDEQIAQANEVAGFMPDEQADGEAAERLQKRSIADLKWSVKARDKVIAKLKRQAREIEKTIREQVSADVDAMPEMQAKRKLDELRKAKQLDDAATATVADAFGYESVEAMMQAIDAFGKRSEVIDGLTEQRMLEENGDLIDERAIQEAANEAVHNEARARSLATELRTQREMLGQRTDTGEVNARGARITVNTLVEAAKQFGARVIARTPLKDLKATAWKHTAAERRAGKRWTEATAAGKTEEAVQAKQDQVLNNAAAKAALEAATEAKKILEFFKRVTKGNDEKTVEKGRDPDIVNAARAVLAAYGVETPTTKAAAAYLEVLQRNDPETYAALEPMVTAATQNAQPLQALTFEELQGLAESIQAMWFLAKRSRQMEVDGDLLDIDEVADQVYARLETIGIPDRVPGEGMAVTQGEERTLFLQQGLAFLRRVEQWAEGMDGKYGGPFLRYIFQPIKDAADRYRKDRIDYRKKFQGLVDNLAPIVGDSVIAAPELGYTFGTPGSTAGTAMNEILHAIAHTGNDSNKRKLLLGRGWATENPDGTLDTSRWDAFIQRLVNEGKLERAHFDFVQGVWDLLEETKPLAQKAHRDAFGRYFSEVTANAFVDPFGVTRRGGYVPAQVDSRQVKDNALRKLAEEENNSMAYAFPQPAMGFTKSRTEYNKPLMLDLRTLSQHLDKVLLFSHMTNPARDVRKLLMRPKVNQPLNRVQPAVIESMLQPWLQRSAQQIVEDPVVGSGKWARIPGIVRSRAGMALMFANVSNAIQQVTGVVGAAVRVKPSHLMRSLAQYVSNPAKFSQAVWAASPYMDDRAKNEVAVMNEQMQAILIQPGTFERVQDFSMRHAYFLQTALDNVLSPIVWTGALNQALADGMSQADAIRFADSTVRQTQGSTLPEDVSRFETGPAYARAFTQFVGYFNMMANTNGTALKQIAGELGLKKGAGKALYVVMMGMMAPIWIAEAIALAFKGGPEDEEGDGYLDDWLAAVFGMGTTKGLLAQIPIVGQFGVAAANRFNDNPLDDRVSLSPAISLLESSVSAPQSVYKAIVEDGSAQKAIRDVATLVSVATGVPLYGLARPLGYAAGVAQGRIEPTGPADAARGLITGTASPESKQR